MVRFHDVPRELRQIAVRELGHEQPTLLLTNQMRESAAVLMKVDVDIQLTLRAGALYRILARRLGNGLENANARTLFRKVVRASAIIYITPREIVVSLGRRAHNQLFLQANYPTCARPSPGSTTVPSGYASYEPTPACFSRTLGIEARAGRLFLPQVVAETIEARSAGFGQGSAFGRDKVFQS